MRGEILLVSHLHLQPPHTPIYLSAPSSDPPSPYGPAPVVSYVDFGPPASPLRYLLAILFVARKIAFLVTRRVAGLRVGPHETGVQIPLVQECFRLIFLRTVE